jgi:hypothetical protein
MTRQTPATTDSSLWKRGLVLFLLILGIAGAVLYALFQRPGREPVPEEVLYPQAALVLGLPASPWPLAGPWGSLYPVLDLLPSSPGWEIRYNATLALARRGHPQVRLDILGEMLEERRQQRNFRIRLPDGRDLPDLAAARRTMLNALVAFREWHKHADAVRAVGPDHPDLQQLYAAVQHLTEHTDNALRAEARDTLLSIKAH